MPTKYKIDVDYLRAEIKEVEIVRETASCVFVPWEKSKYCPSGERKEAKKTGWHEYHDTWEGAHAALMTMAEDKVASARRGLELANSFAGNVKGMLRARMKKNGGENSGD